MSIESKLTPEGLPVVGRQTFEETFRNLHSNSATINYANYITQKIYQVKANNPFIIRYIKEAGEKSHQRMLEMGLSEKDMLELVFLNSNYLVLLYDMLKKQAEANKSNT